MHSHECNPQTVIVCESVAFRKETIPLENKTTQTVLPVLTSKCLLTEFYFKRLFFFLMEKNLSVKGSWINTSDVSSVFILRKGAKL